MRSRGPKESGREEYCLGNCRQTSRGGTQLWAAAQRVQPGLLPPDMGTGVGPGVDGERHSHRQQALQNQEQSLCIFRVEGAGADTGPPGPLRLVAAAPTKGRQCIGFAPACFTC